jgi:copper chaperone
MTISATETRTYRIEGMTCAHCVMSITEEVAQVSGVSAVDVELDSGRLTIRGHGVADDAVMLAVEAAGYGVAP